MLARVSGGSARWSVVEDNDLYDTYVQIGVGADDTRISGNRIQSGGPNTGFFVDGYDANQGLGIDNLAIQHNSVLQPAYDSAHPGGRRFLKLYGAINGLGIDNNVYDPNGVPFGGYDSWGMTLAASAVNINIGGNVWGPAGSLYQGAYHATSDGRITPAAWQTNHPTDTFPTQLDAASIGTAGPGVLAPHAPDTLTATAGAGAIALAWTAAAEGDAADTYNLYRDAGDGDGYRLYQTGLTTTSYSDTAVTSDQRYAYKVAAVNAGGEGKLSDEAWVVSPPAPNLTLSISGASSVEEGAAYTLTITKGGVLADEASSILIDWGDGATQTLAGDITFAIHTYADGPESYSIQTTATVNSLTYTSNALAVSVANVNRTASLDGATTLDEDAPYALYLISSDPGADTVGHWTINWGDGSASQTVSGSPVGVEHYFPGAAGGTIHATVTDEDGTYDAGSISFTVVPSRPAGVTATAISTDSIQIDWIDTSAMESGFAIERSSDGVNFSQIAAVGTDVQAYTDTSLNPATLYYYRVRALGTAGDSAESNADFATTNPLVQITGTDSVDEGAAYTLTLDGGLAGGLTGWTVDWGDGNTEDVAGSATSVDHIYADGLNSYTIAATATDGTNTFDANSLVVRVNNVAPDVSISGDDTFVVGSNYTLNLQTSDTGADTISQWFIDWGDGSDIPILFGPLIAYACGEGEFRQSW